MPLMEFPKVSCRIRIAAAPAISRQYGAKFGQLMERVSSVHYTSAHYRRMATMRAHLEGKDLADVAEMLPNLGVDAMRLLISAAPLFNLASANTKAYILVALLS
jgi:hypothetical protein